MGHMLFVVSCKVWDTSTWKPAGLPCSVLCNVLCKSGTWRMSVSLHSCHSQPSTWDWSTNTYFTQPPKIDQAGFHSNDKSKEVCKQLAITRSSSCNKFHWVFFPCYYILKLAICCETDTYVYYSNLSVENCPYWWMAAFWSATTYA